MRVLRLRLGRTGWLVLCLVIAAPSWAEFRACEQVEGQPSPPSAQKVRVVFINRSEHLRGLYWLDFEGHRKLYTWLKPGQTYDVDSFVGHAWAIVDKRHRCRRGFVVTGVEEVTID